MQLGWDAMEDEKSPKSGGGGGLKYRNFGEYIHV